MQGEIHPDFSAVADVLDEIVVEEEAGGPAGGGAVAAWHHGEKVVDIWTGTRDADGTPWEADTLAMGFSTTKGVTATALHMCVDRALLDYDDPVADHWPEFARNGKDAITVRQVMCHEAGLYPVRSLVEHALELNNWDLMVEALEEAEPAVEPGTANAYHGFTYGWLVGELVRRVSGRTIGEFVRTEIGDPLDLDGLYIGLPDSEVSRLATLFPGRELAALQKASETHDVSGLVAPRGPLAQLTEAMGLEIDPQKIIDAIYPPGMNEWISHPETVKAQVPAANGCFTARSLATLYGALASGGKLGGVGLLSAETLARATEIQNTRPDLVLVMPMQWRLGWHMAFTADGIPPRGFGHFGFGGSGAWADPDHEVSCAFMCNRLGGTAVGDMRRARLGATVWSAAQARD
ncbi:MAG: beta-lactamase family protein [Acidimicrobiia bacterium]|nr:beta-lactamase family protein [Acidimicrobiia bacterium]